MTRQLIAAMLLLIGSGSIACSQAHRHVKGYRLVYKIPLPKKDGGFDSANTYYQVYYSGDLVLYKVFYMFDSIVNHRFLDRTERAYFFVFDKDSSYGMAYFPDSIMKHAQRRRKVDSVLKSMRFESPAYDTFAKMTPDSVIGSGRELIKVYNIPPSAEYPEKYTYRFYYSSEDYPTTETFSGAMDNVHGRKLHKIANYAYGGYWPQLNQTLPEREIVMEMLPASEQEKDEALKYFLLYKAKTTLQ